MLRTTAQSSSMACLEDAVTSIAGIQVVGIHVTGRAACSQVVRPGEGLRRLRLVLLFLVLGAAGFYWDH